jgi:septum site-determining protein MinC
MDELKEKFEQGRSFFSQGSCHITFMGKAFTPSEKLKLETEVAKTLSSCDVTVGYESDTVSDEPVVYTNLNEGYTKFHNGTLRSGQLLESEGNLVVLGHINPGAEVVAAGNIIVMGAAKGILHAGCTGNREAFIIALNMSPTQIRIADIITRPPDNDVRSEILPEKAYIKNETIYIEDYLTKI